MAEAPGLCPAKGRAFSPISRHGTAKDLVAWILMATDRGGIPFARISALLAVVPLPEDQAAPTAACIASATAIAASAAARAASVAASSSA